MRVVRLILYVGLGIFAVGAFVLHGSSAIPVPESAVQNVSYAAVESAVDFHPLGKKTPRVEPVAPAERIVAETPIQPLEERSDDMLFEIDALVGTPFDQVITMPFD